MQRISESSDSVSRVENGQIARMRLTLDALRSLPRGGTTIDVHRAMVELGLANFHERTCYRHLHALSVLDLVESELLRGQCSEVYWWSAAWPSKSPEHR